MPERISRMTQPPKRMCRARSQVSIRAPRANRPADGAMAHSQSPGRRIIRAAPKAAPWETPRKPGSTRGLPRMVWKTRPAAPQACPQKQGDQDTGQAHIQGDAQGHGIGDELGG